MCEQFFFFTDLLLRCVSCELISRSGVVRLGHIMFPSAAPSGKRPADLQTVLTLAAFTSFCIRDRVRRCLRSWKVRIVIKYDQNVTLWVLCLWRNLSVLKASGSVRNVVLMTSYISNLNDVRYSIPLDQRSPTRGSEAACGSLVPP